MGDKIYIGIDNGVTGTIGIVHNGEFADMFKTPVRSVQDYTKKKKNISRLDVQSLTTLIKSWNALNVLSTGNGVHAILERPFMTNEFRKINSIISGHRCFEATLIMLEVHEIPYEVIDSKQWQKELLPSGIKGSANLKKASMEKGIQLFPHLKEIITKHGDADGLLIAEWARRSNL